MNQDHADPPIPPPSTSKARGLQDFFDTINSPGGHILVCLGLLIAYSAWIKTDISHDVVVFALGVISRSMGASRQS